MTGREIGVVRGYDLPAYLGDEREWFGNVVRPVMVERVTYRNGERSSVIVDTGKCALVVPRGGF